jgi:hypothetical protein
LTKRRFQWCRSVRGISARALNSGRNLPFNWCYLGTRVNDKKLQINGIDRCLQRDIGVSFNFLGKRHPFWGVNASISREQSDKSRFCINFSDKSIVSFWDVMKIQYQTVGINSEYRPHSVVFPYPFGCRLRNEWRISTVIDIGNNHEQGFYSQSSS